MKKPETYTCPEGGKEIQNNKKVCKECEKRLLREKIIAANYDAIRVDNGKTIGDIL